MDNLSTQKANLEITLGRGDWQYELTRVGTDLMICTDAKTGKKREFLLLPEADDDGVIRLHADYGQMSRVDGKFFTVPLVTDGYDRPVIEQFGVGHIALIFHDGKVVVEREKFPANPAATEFVEQWRLPRASADNVAYSSLKLGEVVGRDYLDSQRIIYADAPNKFTAGHSDEVPVKNEVVIKDGKQALTGKTVPLETISLKEYGETADGPGKVAFADAVLTYLTADELRALAHKLEVRIDIDACISEAHAENA